MKILMVAVKDSAAGGFAQPMFVPTHAMAIRMFADEVNRAAPDNNLYKHPEDFELHGLGIYDDTDGSFETPTDLRRCLARGQDVKQ